MYIVVVQFSTNKHIEESDAELVESYRNTHDLDILAELYSRYTHLIYGVCLKYLKNREDSQDAVLQIFEVLLKEIPKHEIRIFKNWLHGVTRNYCLMQLRKEKASQKQFETYSRDFFMETEVEMHPIDSQRSRTKSTALRDCLEKLKKVQQECVRLFYYDEQCYREIAAGLNLEEKKVKSAIQNGKRNLKICLESHGSK